MQTIYIVVKLRVAALHFYPDAKNYLANQHRHEFHITCTKLVSHTNREIEIINYKEQIRVWLEHRFRGNFGGRSCEDIALLLITQFQLSYCEVLEDGENGAIVVDNSFIEIEKDI